MILGSNARDVITVRTGRQIKRKMVTAVVKRLYRSPRCIVSFRKRRRLKDLDLVPARYIKGEQSCSECERLGSARRLDDLDSVPFRYIKHEQRESEFQGV